ncbi:hypothetical protein B0A50_06392 [Salinomyces thailandicus]|uniref:Uncharacterized protein n=1 Tax=Salinomyces thailandicus TaxID=706561 RepID=A0A4U0TRX5_9PEZI|nr:hypothetical protein B0A50_06392 [Salinomyces thailandica]
MSSADAQKVANRQASVIAPVEAQEVFPRAFNVDNPDKAMSSYQKLMHQHTMQQFENANVSSRRRPASDAGMASLSTESSRASVSSTAS